MSEFVSADRLAIAGGRPIVTDLLLPYRSVGAAEIQAVVDVLKTGVLSSFADVWGEAFYGGPSVKSLEHLWCEVFGARHAVSMNSATSGLIAAVGAARVGPGDEVIVPPFTMSATAMAPLAYGGIPVFVDIEPDTFCLDPELVAANITPRTKAIIAVNLFGHPAELQRLRALADRHGIVLIEDNAQSPFATEDGSYAGTIGHIGVFSLNHHKHIHTGEGGVCTTDDDDLALRLAMIRNHGENAVEPAGVEDITNLLGFNFRMTELSAALGVVQLTNCEQHVAPRQRLAASLTDAVSDLPGLTGPHVRSGCRHVFHVWSLRYDERIVGVPRRIFSRALAAEGFPNAEGYQKPLYLLPVFARRVAIGSGGFPFTLSQRRYERGSCPVTERMHYSELLSFPNCMYDVSERQAKQLAAAIRRVYHARASLMVHA